MLFDTIHHVAIITSDYDRTIDFYVYKLGFEIVRENKKEERGDVKLDLKLGDSELEIFIRKNPPKRVSFPEEACGLRHLAFKVESVDETVQKLNELGIETERVRYDDYTHKKMTFFKDPDGLPLEIHE